MSVKYTQFDIERQPHHFSIGIHNHNRQLYVVNRDTKEETKWTPETGFQPAFEKLVLSPPEMAVLARRCMQEWDAAEKHWDAKAAEAPESSPFSKFGYGRGDLD